MADTAQTACPPDEDIAIVGMAGVFPRAGDVREFWQNIMQRVDGIGDPPPEWRPETFVAAGSRENDRIYTGKGGYLGEQFRFDPSRYGVVPTAMDGAEPDQFLALRVAFETLADAGAPARELPRERTGVILGRGVYMNRGSLSWVANGYFVEELIGLLRQLEPNRSENELAELKADLKRRLPSFNQDTVPGLISSIIAGRIANRFDLRGPSYMVDAACASSLLAVEQGMRALREGRCDAVLAGGVQASTPPVVQVLLAQVGALSAQGRITPFSREASGMLVGEGCGMLLLMRRSDAERQGHRIYCLLKGMGSSSDGKGSGILAPKSAGQRLAVRQAYAESGINPSSVSLIEAHGTGTPVGDAAELDTVFEAFGERSAACPKVAMGTVKSMIGHLLPAAGAASLIKTALALYHRTLPPTLHGETAVDRLQAEDGPIYLVSEPRPWVHSDLQTPRRAAVNAFGFGGINAHAVLEEYPHTDQDQLPRFERTWPCELVVLSAESRAALLARCTSLAEWLERSSATLVDVAATCARERGPERLAIVAADVPELVRKLRHAAKLLADPARTKIQDRGGVFWFSQPLARAGRVAFVFPGEGAQYPGMLSELGRHFPSVRRQFDLTDAGFLRYGQAGLLSQVIYPPRGVGKTPDQALLNLEGAVGAVTAANRALLALLEQLEVRADAVVGHSSGEFAALYAAGAHRPADDAALVSAIAEGAAAAARIHREGLAPEAVLTAVGGVAPAAVARALAESAGRVVVAMDNCPNQVIVSGDEASTDLFAKSLAGQGGLCERLMWGRAYHTAAFAPACQPLDDYYRFLELQTPTTELWSCATAARFPSDPAAVRELAVRQWRSPVRFRETIENMHAAGVRLFIEVGPRGGLTGFVSDALGDRPHVAVALDSARRGGLQQLCQTMGLLAAHGVDLKLEALTAARSPTLLDFSQAPLAPPAEFPPLPFELPRFTVSNEMAEQWQASKPKRDPSKELARPAPTESTGPGNGHEGQNGHRPAASPAPRAPANRISSPAPAPAAAPRARPETPPVPAAAPTRAILADFQRTMQDFLLLQQRVITTALQPELGPHFRPANSARADSQETHRGLFANIADIPLTAFDLRTTIFDPPNRVVLTCELDPNRHRFLVDHAFYGRNISQDDADLRPLLVMPLAMSLELMAEAASLLRPGLKIAAIRDVQTKKWLTFEETSREVRLEARALDGDDVQVTLSDGEGCDPSATVANGCFEFRKRPSALPPPALSRCKTANTTWAPEHIYGCGYFHGPAFHVLKAVRALDLTGVVADLVEPAEGLMFVDRRPPLLLPVALIDSLGQMAGLAITGPPPRIGQTEVQVTYPNRIGRLEFSAERPQESLSGVAVVERNQSHMRYQAEVLSADGRVLLRALDRVDEIVPMAGGIYLHWSHPDKMALASDLTDHFSTVPNAVHFRVCRTRAAGDRLLMKQLWQRALAKMTLSRRELRLLDEQQLPPLQAAAFILGRVVAKEALRLLSGERRPLPDIPVLRASTGAPTVTGSHAQHYGVNLAHQGFHAYAVAFDLNQLAGAGIDVEPVASEPLAARIPDHALTALERTLIAKAANASTHDETAWRRAVWTAKVAFVKALGAVDAQPWETEVVQHNPTLGSMTIAPRGTLATDRGKPWIRGIDVAYRALDGHFVAICVLPRAGDSLSGKTHIRPR